MINSFKDVNFNDVEEIPNISPKLTLSLNLRLLIHYVGDIH